MTTSRPRRPSRLGVAPSELSLGASHDRPLDGSRMTAQCQPDPVRAGIPGSPSNRAVNASVRPVTPLAVASVAPVRPARYRGR